MNTARCIALADGPPSRGDLPPSEWGFSGEGITEKESIQGVGKGETKHNVSWKSGRETVVTYPVNV